MLKRLQVGRVVGQGDLHNVSFADVGFLEGSRYLIHDRDSKYCAAFLETLEAVGIESVKLPAKSPNLNAYAERWVRSVKSECLSKLILFGEASLRRALTDFEEHYHVERPHQSKGNEVLVRSRERGGGEIKCRDRLGGLLKYYYREAG